MSIVQFTPASDLDKKIEITKDTLIKTSSSTGKDCRFNTSYDVDLLPLRITDAKLMPRPFVTPGSTCRSEERRVGKECRGWWWLYLYIINRCHVVHSVG